MDIAAFRNMGTQGNLVIDNQQGTQSIRKANFFENVGAFFKTANSQTRNANVLSHLKEAIAREPQYFGVQTEAKEAIRALAKDKPIKASAIQDILAKLDGLSTPKARKAYVKQQFLQRAQQNYGNSDARNPFGLPASLNGENPSVKAAYSDLMQDVCDRAVQTHPNLHTLNVDGLRQQIEMTTDSAVHTSKRLPEQSRDIFIKQALKRQIPPKQMHLFEEKFAQLANDPQISRNRLHEAAKDLFTDTRGSELKEGNAFKEVVTAARNKTFIDTLTPSSPMFDGLKTRLESAKLDNSVVAAMKNSMIVKANDVAKDGTAPLTQQTLLSHLQNVMDGYDHCNAIMTLRTVGNDSAMDLTNLSLAKFTKGAPTPAYISALQDKSDSMPPALMKNVLSAKGPEQLFTAIKNIMTTVHSAENELKAVHKQVSNIPAGHAALHILGQQIAKLSPAEQDALRALFKSSDMTELRIAVTPHLGRGFHPMIQKTENIINTLIENLEAMSVFYHAPSVSGQDPSLGGFQLDPQTHFATK